MAYVLRRAVILVATLALLVTSVGWNTAGALMGLKTGHETKIASTTHHSADHSHAVRASEHASSCSEAEDCDSDAWHHEDLADSCCGTACHIAAEPNACAEVLVSIVHALDGISPEDDLKEASSARLERPPRSIAA